VASSTGIFYSSDLGAEWHSIGQGINGRIECFGIDHQDNIYVGLYQYVIPDGSGGVYFSSDNGQSWEFRNQGIETASIRKIEFDDNNNAYLFTRDTSALSLSTSMVYKWDEQGMEWIRIFNAATYQDTVSAIPFNDMELTPAGDIFLGGVAPPFDAATVYSHDQGATWNVFQDASQGWIDHIEIAPGNVIYALGSVNSYYTSSDNGATWVIHSILDWPETDEFLIDHAGHFITTGNNEGYNYSVDMGQTWTNIGEGLASNNGFYHVYTTAFDQNDNLFTFTFDGFYTTDMTVGLPELSQSGVKGLEVKLFPNPVKDKMQLDISSPEDGPAKILIYDISGRELFSSEAIIRNGSASVQIRASNISGGIYFYSLESNGNVSNGKFMKY
jgi:photosystem II stability/assembly factor-like uncharacterized protein